jgi:hypothetical protein
MLRVDESHGILDSHQTHRNLHHWLFEFCHQAFSTRWKVVQKYREELMRTLTPAPEEDLIVRSQVLGVDGLHLVSQFPKFVGGYLCADEDCDFVEEDLGMKRGFLREL